MEGKEGFIFHPISQTFSFYLNIDIPLRNSIYQAFKMNTLICFLIFCALVQLADFYSTVSTDKNNKQDQMLKKHLVKKSFGLLIPYLNKLYKYAEERQAKANNAKEGKKKQISVMFGNWKMIAKQSEEENSV